MIATLTFILGAGLVDSPAPETRPALVAIGGFLSEDARSGSEWSDEPPGYRRCRVYRCGLPELPSGLKRRLESRTGDGEQGK